MTKDEAAAFLERNPRIAEKINKSPPDPELFDCLLLPGLADNEQDAMVNIVAVVRALR